MSAVHQHYPSTNNFSAAALAAGRMYVTDAAKSDESTVILTLNDSGIICDCNGAGCKLLGCTRNALSWRHVSGLLPQLHKTALLKNAHINPTLRFLSRVGHPFEVVTLNGLHFYAELFFSEIENLGKHTLQVIISPLQAH
jgi:PAS domain-containing protein